MELLGVALNGEAGVIHNAFLKSWDPNNERLLEVRRNRRAEEIRVIWQDYWQYEASWATQRATSGLKRAFDHLKMRNRRTSRASSTCYHNAM